MEKDLTSKQKLEEWFTPYQPEKALILYGLEGEALPEILLSWLDKDPLRALLLLGESKEHIYAFKKSAGGKKLLLEKGVELLEVPDPSEEEPFLKKLLDFKKYESLSFIAVPATEANPDRYLFIRATWNYLRQTSLWSLSELLDGGALHFSNLYANLVWLKEALPASILFNAFKKVPAIIIGPGPSLKKNGKLLTKLRNQALLISGGTGINVLNQMGIRPHLTLGIDPHESASSRLTSSANFGVPFVFSGRLNKNTLWNSASPLLYMPSSSFALERKIEESLLIPPFPPSNGGNVLNQATQMAYLMGCDPIIFVGVDLAFTGGENYAFPIQKNGFTPEHIRAASPKEPILHREDIHNNPIQTLQKWVFEAFWYGNFQLEHPEITLLNATEGGLGFPKVQDAVLTDVEKKISHKIRNFDQEIKDLLAKNEEKKISEKKIHATYQELFESLSSFYKKILSLQEQNSLDPSRLKEERAYPLFEEFLTQYVDLHTSLKKSGKSANLESPFQYLKTVVECHLGLLSSAVRNAAFHKSVYSQPPQKEDQIPLKDGLVDGWVTLFWPSGIVRRKIFYREGLRDGSDEFFRASGQLFRKGSYRQDRPIGHFVEYNEQNEPCRLLEYEPLGSLQSEKVHTADGRWKTRPKAEDFWSDLVDQTKKVAYHLQTGAHFLGENLNAENEELLQKMDSLSALSEELSLQYEKELDALTGADLLIGETQKRLNLHTLNMNSLLFEIQRSITALKNEPHS